jgi:hypothetical protein
VREDFNEGESPFDAVEQAAPPGMSAADSMARAAELVRDGAARLVRSLSANG